MTKCDQIEIELTSNDLGLIKDLAADPQEKLKLGRARRVSGFGETLGALALSAGAAGIPAGVLASLLANWIWKHLGRRKGITIHAEIRYGEKIVELDLTGEDSDVAAAIMGAITNVAEQ